MSTEIRKARQKVHLSDAMRKRLREEKINEASVYLSTRKFFLGSHRHKAAENLEVLARSGLVDFGARYGADKLRWDEFWTVLLPNCPDAILTNPTFHPDLSLDERVQKMTNWAIENKHFDILDHLIDEYDAAYSLCNNLEHKKLLKQDELYAHLIKRGVKKPPIEDWKVAQNISSFITTPAPKSYKAAIEAGWPVEIPGTLQDAAESFSIRYVEILEANGYPIVCHAKYHALTSERHTYKVNGKAVGALGAFEAIYNGIMQEWQTVNAKLAKPFTAHKTLDGEDLLCAANMGDIYLRRFLNPRIWRGHSDRLSALIEEAPLLLQRQVKLLQPEPSSEHSTGWGR